MKVAIFHMGFMYTGGGERVVIEETAALRERGYEVDVFAAAIDEKECFPDLIGTLKVQGVLPRVNIWLPCRDMLSLLLSSSLAPILATRFAKYDVFLSHGQPSAWLGYCASRILHKPYLVYIYQPLRLLYPRSIDKETGWRTKRDFAILDKLLKPFRPLVATLDRISVASARELFVVSRWVAQAVERVYGLTPTVCYPGTNFTTEGHERCSPPSIQVNGHQLPERYLLTTNRHYPQKRLDYMIEVMSLLKERYDVHLLITGGFTNYTPFLRGLVTRAGLEERVHFLGRVDDRDLEALYRHAEAYLYTSPNEDLGMGIIESMACGVPPIAWGYGGPKEIIQNGANGLLAEPYSTQDFAAKVSLLLSDQGLRRRLGENGHKSVRERFSWKGHIDIISNALEEACRAGVEAPPRRLPTAREEHPARALE